MKKDQNDEWSVNTLKLYLEALINENDRRYEQRFVSQQREVGLALAAVKEASSKEETATEKRFEGVNEFRAALSDQQRTLMPRAESELLIKSLDERITRMAFTLSEKKGEGAGIKNAWAYLLALVGLASTILSFFR